MTVGTAAAAISNYHYHHHLVFKIIFSFNMVSSSNTLGGYELLFKNLVSSYSNQLNDNTHDLIPVMRQLTKLAHKSSNGTAQLLLNAVWEAEKDHGLVNYAPFGKDVLLYILG